MEIKPPAAGDKFDASYERSDNEQRRRHGHLWSPSEYAQLDTLFQAGALLKDLCDTLERPAAGILAKLVQRRWLTYSQANHTYSYTSRIALPLPSRPSTSKENTMSAIVIENNTTVNGKDIKEMSDSELFGLIAQQEACIEKLSAIKHKPKRLQEELVKRQQGIEALVALLDAQG